MGTALGSVRLESAVQEGLEGEMEARNGSSGSMELVVEEKDLVAGTAGIIERVVSGCWTSSV